jgi:glycosyltransferase involved in cell wall biosynthesis
MSTKQTTMWIAWEDDTSIRSKVLADEMRADYRAFTRFTRSKYFAWLRYPVAGAQTLWAILTRRPRVLVVQNPSILLAFQAAVLKPLFGYELIIDLHTPFLNPKGIKKTIFNLLHAYGLRNCSAVIVTNEAYQKRVARQTSRPVLILPDKIPELKGECTHMPLRGRLNVVYICTFSIDEPWREVVEAGRMLPDDICVYITGRNSVNQDDLPGNITLTGYLTRQDYQNLLRSVDAALVLTTADENLVCGGYEAVAAGKPLILSNTRALKSYFRKGTVFTENRRHDIAQAIRSLDANAPALAQDIRSLKRELVESWEQQWHTLLRRFELAEETDVVRQAPSSVTTIA